MTDKASATAVALSIVLPASNEAALIGTCLDAVLASVTEDQTVVQVIVVANGCTDDTAARAAAFADRFASRGWCLDVIERAEGGKLGALNAGDAAARAANRLYLDADVTVSSELLGQILKVLDRPEPIYASGHVQITAKGAISKAYARVWAKVPFMRDCVPGCGLFAVNQGGRQRWGAFPDIISDDTFVRLCFAPAERIGVPAAYQWPVAEGLQNLIKVRRRQDIGVAQINSTYPQLCENDDARPFSLRQKLSIALQDPFGFFVYVSVAVIVKVTKSKDNGWSRGR